MSDLASSAVNPRIITWARMRSGLTVDSLAAKMKKSVDEILRWENGTKVPSYTSLEKLAYRHFKVPIAVFFFPEPPELEDPIKKYRRLPDCELLRFSSDTLYKIRLAQGYQDSLRELMIGMEPGKKIFHDLKTSGFTPSQVANQIRDYLGISQTKQFAWHSSEKAFKYWRHAITEAGVFVFKDAIKDKFVSGFCLLDQDWPIIFINNSTPYTRQTFTLVHELAHILFEIHGVTDLDESYVDYMNERDRSLEIICNKIAGQVLVPDELFEKEIPIYLEEGIKGISKIADKYSASREVILRKLLDHGIIDNQEYESQVSEWLKDLLRKKPRPSGGNPYLTKLAYLGESFTKLAFANYSAGRLDQADLAYHLNMKSRYIEKLEKYIRW